MKEIFLGWGFTFLWVTSEKFSLFETTRVSESLEGLNRSLAQLVGELWPLAKYAQGYLLWDLKFIHFFAFEP